MLTGPKFKNGVQWGVVGPKIQKWAIAPDPNSKTR